MTRSTQFPIGLLALALMACGPDSVLPTEGTGPGSPSFSAAPSRSMSGTCSTTYVVSDITFLPPPDDDIVVSFVATHEGTCQLAHLGQASLRKTELVTTDENGAHVQGAALVLTAANGDELHATENAEIGGFQEDGGFSFTGSWTFAGGTGRFSHATGAVDFTGTGNTNAGTSLRSLQGSISY